MKRKEPELIMELRAELKELKKQFRYSCFVQRKFERMVDDRDRKIENLRLLIRRLEKGTVIIGDLLEKIKDELHV